MRLLDMLLGTDVTSGSRTHQDKTGNPLIDGPARDERLRLLEEDPLGAFAGPQQQSRGLAREMVDYLRDVLTGRVAAENMPRSHYDPNRSFSQNASDPRAIDEAMNVAMGVGPGALIKRGGPIRAHHGSPYDFDKFDMSKIGTGEGAQTYGHGLYFAENPATAKAYRDTLGTGTYKTSSGDVLHRGSVFEMLMNAASNAQLATQRGKQFSLHPDQARAVADNLLSGIDDAGSIKKYLRDYDLPSGQFGVAYQQAAQKANELGLKLNKGRMYEVDIHADPDAFLHWDKPLSAQSAQVKDSLSDKIEFWDKLAALSGKRSATDASGRVLYNSIGERPDASAELLSRGIPGIRYLDQGSRGAGDGTHNLVVFDDSLIEILRKYGLAGLLGGAGAAAAGNPYSGEGR